MTWPIVVVDIVLILTSVVLALFILLHKSRGGGMSDLFGGGMSTGMGGKSMAERNLDKMTLAVGGVWLASILGLLVLYRFFPDIGSLNPVIPEAAASATAAPTDLIPVEMPSATPELPAVTESASGAAVPEPSSTASK